MIIINLTQHEATPEQVQAGVVEPPKEVKNDIRELLTFEQIPTKKEIQDRAHDLGLIAAMTDLSPSGDGEHYALSAMIGGAPFLMSALESALLDNGVTPLYAFSVRESQEKIMQDGSVSKVAIFRHKGFIRI